MLEEESKTGSGSGSYGEGVVIVGGEGCVGGGPWMDDGGCKVGNGVGIATGRTQERQKSKEETEDYDKTKNRQDELLLLTDAGVERRQSVLPEDAPEI